MKDKNLMTYLASVPDPRVKNRTDHKLIDILVITVCAILCGCNEWIEIEEFGVLKIEWLKTFLELPNGIPSHDTIARVLSILDPEELQKAFCDWVRNVNELLPREIISIDGKILRGVGKNSKTIGIVSAWASEVGVVLGQKKMEHKKGAGEKRATEELLDLLSIKGCIVTLDAGGATTRITSKITEKQGDYVIGLKENQKKLTKYAKIGFEKFPENVEIYETSEKGHGRVEKRKYEFLAIKDLQISVTNTFQKTKIKWGTLNSFCRVTSERTSGGKTSIDTRYFFSSLKENVSECARAIRKHWGVENELHWQMDVTFKEDESRIRIGHAAENIGLIRRMTLNMLKKDTSKKKSINLKRLKCSLNEEYALNILLGRF